MSSPPPPFVSPTSPSTNTPDNQSQIQEDLHVPIAFASKIIGTDPSSPTEVRQTQSYVPNSIMPDKRTFPILDALASACVFQASGQVLAVALRMDQNANVIYLSVAENRAHGVQPRVVQQIKDIWSMLRSLSSERCRLRSLPRADKSAADEYSATRVQLIRLVYTFCWEKMNQRVRKWWPGVDALSMKIAAYLSIDGKHDASGLMKKFLGAAVMLRNALPLITNPPDESFPIDPWIAFCMRMDTAVEKAVEILNDDDQCQAWGALFQGVFRRSHSPVQIDLTPCVRAFR